MMRFSGKVALVTGAAVGIGRASAIMLASEGAKVIALDIDKKGLDELDNASYISGQNIQIDGCRKFL